MLVLMDDAIEGMPRPSVSVIDEPQRQRPQFSPTDIQCECKNLSC